MKTFNTIAQACQALTNKYGSYQAAHAAVRKMIEAGEIFIKRNVLHSKKKIK